MDYESGPGESPSEFSLSKWPIWNRMAEAGLFIRSGHLETGHRVIFSYSNEHGQWFANLYHPQDPTGRGDSRCVWLGDDDEQVPRRFAEALRDRETMTYLLKTMAQ